jgi:rubrerythrin
MICLVGCVTPAIKGLEIATVALTAWQTHEARKDIEVISDCPKWFKPIIPDDDYKYRWSRKEKEQLNIQLKDYFEFCDKAK